MYLKEDARADLRTVLWKDGEITRLAKGPYRHVMIVHCSSVGRQRAEFANGNHPYFCYFEIVNNDDAWIQKGAAMVPVLPDGKLIMVVEQRPPQGRYPNRPMMAEITGKNVDLKKFGPYSSLEFPGGAVEPGESLKAAFLHELTDETGVDRQEAITYRRTHPVYPFGSDVAIQNFLSVVFLSNLRYENRVEADGGLAVFSLTKEEVQRNIWKGVIHSGQAAINPWNFYLEIEAARKDTNLLYYLLQQGYISVGSIRIEKPRGVF